MQRPEKQENEFIWKLIIKFIKFFKFMYSLSSKLLYLHTFCCITLHCIMCCNWLRNFYNCMTKTFYDVFRLAFPWSFIKIYRSMVQMRQGSIVGLKKLKHMFIMFIIVSFSILLGAFFLSFFFCHFLSCFLHWSRYSLSLSKKKKTQKKQLMSICTQN